MKDEPNKDELLERRKPIVNSFGPTVGPPRSEATPHHRILLRIAQTHRARSKRVAKPTLPKTPWD